ncbi:MAG TPA: FAD binding domain-containing protein, partial [Glycomyces sp.]|nr:FAD binding domain-containing protein [Glycomyces sp.]
MKAPAPSPPDATLRADASLAARGSTTATAPTDIASTDIASGGATATLAAARVSASLPVSGSATDTVATAASTAPRTDFAFHLPADLAEALHLLADDPEAVPVAGGTDLMVAINYRHTRPAAMLDLTGLAELREWTDEGDAIRIGSGVSYARVIAELATVLPGLAAASRTVGSPQIRNRGTLGGNLATASPAGDGHPPLLATGATIEIASAATTTAAVTAGGRGTTTIASSSADSTGDGRSTLPAAGSTAQSASGFSALDSGTAAPGVRPGPAANTEGALASRTSTPTAGSSAPLSGSGSVASTGDRAIRTRTVPVAEFFAGPKRSVLLPGELITAIIVPKAAGPQQFLKVGTRNAMVIAVCSFAVALDLDARRLGTGIGSAGPTPLTAPEAERIDLPWAAPGRFDDALAE